MAATISYQQCDKYGKQPHKYIEFNVDPNIDGVIDVSNINRSGRYFEFHYTGDIRYANHYHAGNRVGLQYTFHDIGRNGAQYEVPAQVLSMVGGKSERTYELYPSGNLQSITDHVNGEYTEFTIHGNITYRSFNDEGNHFRVWYKKGAPLTMIINERENDYGWKIEYAGKTLRQVQYGRLYGTNFIKEKHGLHITRYCKDINVQFFQNNELVTNEVKQMALDPVLMSEAEETMISMALDQEFRAVVPEFIRDEYTAWIAKNRTKLVYV